MLISTHGKSACVTTEVLLNFPGPLSSATFLLSARGMRARCPHCACQVRRGTLLASEGPQMPITCRASVKQPARKTFWSSAAPPELGLRSATC